MDKLKTYLKHPLSFVLLILIGLASIITVASIIFIIIYILVNGIPNLTTDLFSLHYNSKNQSMLPSIFNTVFITFLTLLIAVPIGIFSAVYLVEYAKKGSKLVKVIRVTTIVFGLFGFLAFVIALGWGYSMIAGVLTLVMMVLPTIIRTTEEALLAVPNSYREGSFGLGAGKIRTIFKIIVPTAIPGILSGVILAIGRIVGETAALIYTSGTVAETATSLTDSARTLSVHLYCLLSEGLFTNQAYATAVILLLLVVGINALSNFIAKKLAKK